MTTTAPLAGLQDWYLRACDGEWGGAAGVQIDPRETGWTLEAELGGAAGACRAGTPELSITRTADDWLHAWVDGGRFHADCGPLTLTEAIKTYLAWSDGPATDA